MDLKQLKNLKKYEKATDVPLTVDLYRMASDCGVTVYQLFEFIQPEQGSSLSAFDRQLQASGIVVKSDPTRGIYSSPGEYFFQSDRPGSAILFPAFLQKTALWAKQNLVNDINDIIAATRTITGTSTYAALSVDDSEIIGANAAGRRFRVDQRGNFPTVNIKWADMASSVTKHGVRLNWSYEFVRRASIELISLVVSRIMIQDQIEVFNDAIDMAINGDGTAANPAATVFKFVGPAYTGDMTNKLRLENSLLPDAGVITYEGWLKWLAGFKPYAPTAICGNLNTLVKIVMMERPNVDPAGVITMLLEAKTQGGAKLSTKVFPEVTLYLVDSVPDNTLVGLDKAYALERVLELGSDIQEAEKVIKNQTEDMIISIADNVSKIFNKAIQVLDFSAAPANV